MGKTVFYSWQSDLPNKTNRNFIEDALKKAIKRVGRDLEIHKALRDHKLALDKDTKGVPGIPPIADVIFNKIENCAIFVPDISFVAKTTKGRLVPNPNVLIEYGWALKCLSYLRIIPVVNSAYGEPTAVNLPFDMRHLRKPITYNLSEMPEEGARKTAKNDLVKKLEHAIKQIISSDQLNKANHEDNIFESMPSTTDPASFFEPEEVFNYSGEFDYKQKRLYFSDSQRLFLRIIPQSKNVQLRTAKEAVDVAKSGNLVPMGDRIKSLTYGRNKYGAYVFVDFKDRILNFTQLFLNGELWGIDGVAIEKERLMERAGVPFGYFPCVSFENVFIMTLGNYLSLAKDHLNLTLPIKFIAGATHVEGYKMTAPNRIPVNFERFSEEVVNQHIHYSGLIEDYLENPRTILRPFFDYVWEECGAERPDVTALG